MKSYPMPATGFDGAKFAARYSLSSLRGDFWSDGKFIYVPDGLPDDPPIFEGPDTAVPTPAGILVHAMPPISKKIGSKVVDGGGTPAFYIVVDTEAKLSDPWFTGIVIDIGSSAYIMDKAKTLVWDGIKWK